MKKILTLALALMLLVILAACGGNGTVNPPSGSDGSTQSTPLSTTTPSETKPSGNKEADLTTVSGWLSYWGLTENDFKCAHFTRLDKTAYNLETKVINDVGAYCDAKLTEEEVRAWLGQILAKLNSLSAEGKVVNTHDNNAELTVDYIISKGQSYLYNIPGRFTYNGKVTSVIITVYPNSLDNADPDEAMPSCNLSLHH